MVCLGINQSKFSKWNQICGETNLGWYYTGFEGKKVGFCTNMKSWNWADFKHSLVFETNVNGSTLKAKVDTDQNIELSRVQKIGKSTDFVFSFGYKHKETIKGDQLPFNFGMKLKLAE